MLQTKNKSFFVMSSSGKYIFFIMNSFLCIVYGIMPSVNRTPFDKFSYQNILRRKVTENIITITKSQYYFLFHDGFICICPSLVLTLHYGTNFGD